MKVYWAGPILGGCTAGFLYESLFAANASVAKANEYLLGTDFDPKRKTYSPVHRKGDEIAVVDMSFRS